MAGVRIPADLAEGIDDAEVDVAATKWLVVVAVVSSQLHTAAAGASSRTRRTAYRAKWSSRPNSASAMSAAPAATDAKQRSMHRASASATPARWNATTAVASAVEVALWWWFGGKWPAPALPPLGPRAAAALVLDAAPPAAVGEFAADDCTEIPNGFAAVREEAAAATVRQRTMRARADIRSARVRLRKRAATSCAVSFAGEVGATRIASRTAVAALTLPEARASIAV
jgi:hypothetical protein